MADRNEFTSTRKEVEEVGCVESFKKVVEGSKSGFEGTAKGMKAVWSFSIGAVDGE